MVLFDLIFYCYYAFPSDSPEDISRIFGKDYFQKVIEPEAADEFRNIVQELSVRAVVTFNKGIYNHISKDPIDRSLEWLMKGKLIRDELKDISQKIPVFLTFPTGWRYHKQYMEFRKNSLILIKDAICRDNTR